MGWVGGGKGAGQGGLFAVPSGEGCGWSVGGVGWKEEEEEEGEREGGVALLRFHPPSFQCEREREREREAGVSSSTHVAPCVDAPTHPPRPWARGMGERGDGVGGWVGGWSVGPCGGECGWVGGFQGGVQPPPPGGLSHGRLLSPQSFSLDVSGASEFRVLSWPFSFSSSSSSSSSHP